MESEPINNGLDRNMSLSINKAGEINGLVGGWIYHRGGGFFSKKGWTWEGKGAESSGEWYLNQRDGKAYWMGPTHSEYPRISDSRFAPVQLAIEGDKKIVWNPFYPVFSRGASPNHMAPGPTTPPRYNVTTSVLGYPPNQYSTPPPNPYGFGSARSYAQGSQNRAYAGPGSAASYVPMGTQNRAYAGPGSAAAYYRGGAKKRRSTRRKQKKTKSKRRTVRA